MDENPIVIAGPIGTFQFQDEVINGMTLLDLIAQVTPKLKPETKVLTFHVNSLGGHDETGIAMYNYITSLKSRGITIEMVQIGVVGSTATRIFLAGDRRVGLDDGSENWFIHNPWIPQASGDANEMQAITDALRIKETSMRNFYEQITGVSAEGLKPLMDAQTSFPAKKALALNFVTEITQDLKLAAYIMEKQNKSKTLQLLNELVAFLKPTKEDEIVAIVIELEGGVKASFPSIDDASKLAAELPVFAVDADGNATQEPLADGEYATADGTKFSVVGGITQMAAAEEPAPEEDAAITAAIENLVNTIKAMPKPMVAEDVAKVVDEKVTAQITALKSEIKSSFKPPVYQGKDKAADTLEWDATFKAGEHADMKQNDPEKYKRLFMAKHNKLPNM